MVLDIRRSSRFSFKGGFTFSAIVYGSGGFSSMKEMDREGATRLPATVTDGGSPVLPPVKVSIGRRLSSSTVSTPEIEKKYVHHVYDAIAPHFSSTRFAKWPKVSSFLNSLPVGSLVLDAGCGNGKYLGNEVLVADAVNLPYRTGYGDAAISIAVLHHLSTGSRRRKAVEELLRVVKKGGLVLITVWAREQEDGSLLNKWTPLNQKYLEEWVGPGSPRVRSPSSPLTLESIPETEENCPREPLKESSLKFSDVKSLEVGSLNSESADSSSLASEVEKGSDDHQEFFVPWHLPYHRAEVSGASANALASGLAKKDDKKGAVVYNRYYHVFSEGELERLVSGIDNAVVVDRFYDKSNWCIILEKTS